MKQKKLIQILKVVKNLLVKSLKLLQIQVEKKFIFTNKHNTVLKEVIKLVLKKTKNLGNGMIKK